MPYTCVGFVVMLVSRRRRRGVLSRAVGHQGATAGRPGERAAAASQLAPSARARAWRRSAAGALAAALSHAYAGDAYQGAKTT